MIFHIEHFGVENVEIILEMAKLVILTFRWPQSCSSHIWPLNQNLDNSNCHLFLIKSILALKRLNQLKNGKVIHFEVIGDQMEVMVWSVSYWNLKNISKTYPAKKHSFQAQFKVPKYYTSIVNIWINIGRIYSIAAQKKAFYIQYISDDKRGPSIYSLHDKSAGSTFARYSIYKELNIYFYLMLPAVLYLY